MILGGNSLIKSYTQNNMLNPVKTIIQAIFKNRPARIISCCLIWPVAKTIAFGGVATGSIKAHEAAMAINTDRITGDMPNASATEANTGMSNAALAVLLAILGQKHHECCNHQDNNKYPHMSHHPANLVCQEQAGARLFQHIT